MIDSWVAYVKRHHPEMLQPQWWAGLWRKQRLSGVQLGIRPTTGAPAGRVEVGQTLSGYPAHGRLLPGDQILRVDGRPLDPEHPLASLSRLVATRRRTDGITVRVLRGAGELDVEIPMEAAQWDAAHLQPVELLRQAALVLRIFRSAPYALWQPSPELINARLELRFAPFAPASQTKPE